MKNFFKKYEKPIKILSIILLFVLVSMLSALILNFFGIITFTDGQININQEMFDSFKTTWYGCVIVVFIQVVVTSLLSFVPGASMAFIMLVQKMYNDIILAFFLAFTGVILSSFMMYIIGRFGGYNLCKKLLGEEDCEKASDLLNNKGTVYFPLMMTFPMFPDDALVMVAGTLKMSLKWFIPSIIFGRGIGVATAVFFSSITDSFTSIWHWVIFIPICIIIVVGVFFGAHKFNKYLENKKNKAKTDENSSTETK